jgi:hypothetical protein
MTEIAQLAEASTFELQQMAQAGNQQAADLLAQKQQWTKLTSPPAPPAPGTAGINILA